MSPRRPLRPLRPLEQPWWRLWVRRSEYDEACDVIRQLEENVAIARSLSAEKDLLIAEQRIVLDTQRTYAADVLSKYHELRLMGAVAPLPRATLAPATASDVADAIALTANNDAALARHLFRWAKRSQLEGANEQTIINAILHWKGDDELTTDPFVQTVKRDDPGSPMPS